MTIRGKLIYNSEPLPGIEILVKVGAKSYKATTDNAGAYVVTVKNRSVKRGAAIVASTVGGEVESAKGMTMSLRRKR
jgi:hypothetical protein